MTAAPTGDHLRVLLSRREHLSGIHPALLADNALECGGANARCGLCDECAHIGVLDGYGWRACAEDDRPGDPIEWFPGLVQGDTIDAFHRAEAAARKLARSLAGDAPASGCLVRVMRGAVEHEGAGRFCARWDQALASSRRGPRPQRDTTARTINDLQELIDHREHPSRAFLESIVATLRRLDHLINTAHTTDFLEAVPLEAAHQRYRWGEGHDAAKTHDHWFWLIGYLAGKALRNALDGNTAKAQHHTISTAAALLHWHTALSLSLPSQGSEVSGSSTPGSG